MGILKMFDKVEETKSDYENLVDAFHIAVENMKAAEARYNNADSMYCDVAAMEYEAARCKVDVLLKEIKTLEKNN